MNKIILLISFGFVLVMSNGSYAAVERLADIISKTHVQRALVSTRQTTITNTTSNVCAISPFTYVPDVETFDVNEIGPDSILQEQLYKG